MHFQFIVLMILLEILAGVSSSKEQLFIIKVILFTLRYLIIKING